MAPKRAPATKRPRPPASGDDDDGSAACCHTRAQRLSRLASELALEGDVRASAAFLAPLLLAARRLGDSAALGGGTSERPADECARLVRLCCTAARPRLGAPNWEGAGGGAERVYTEVVVARTREPGPMCARARATARISAPVVARAFFAPVPGRWAQSDRRTRCAARGAAACHLALMRSATGGSAALASDLMGVVLSFAAAATGGAAFVGAGYSSLPNADEALLCAALHDVLEAGQCPDSRAALNGMVATSVPRALRPPTLDADGVAPRLYALRGAKHADKEVCKAAGGVWCATTRVWALRASPLLAPAYCFGAVEPCATDGRLPAELPYPGRPVEPIARAVRRWEAREIDTRAACREIAAAVADAHNRARAVPALLGR